MPDQRAGAPVDAPGPTGGTVLVACDDEQVREVVARVVEADGPAVVRLDATSDLADAVAAHGADAVVLDLGAANLEVLAGLRAHPEGSARDVRVVVVGTGPAGGRLAWQAGADGFLTRPFHARELQAAVAEARSVADGDARDARRTAGAGTP